MSTLLKFLEVPLNRGIFYWLKFWFFGFINSLKSRKMSNKIDNNWKNVKIKSTVFPDNMPTEVKLEYHWNISYPDRKVKVSNNIFKYLQEENQKQKKLWKRK